MAKILSKERVIEYSVEFKIGVVELTNQLDVEAAQIATVLGLHPMMVYRWRQEHREGKFVAMPTRRISMTTEPPDKPQAKKEESEVKRLQREIAELKKENDFFKKVGRVSEGTKAARFGFIAEHRATFGVRYLCKRLSVSPQGFYTWLDRGVSSRELENRRLSTRINEIFVEHNGNYGSPRVYHALRHEGELVNHKRVERLMREMGLVGKVSRLYRTKPLAKNPCIALANIRRQEAPPTGVNQQWAGDVTYLRVNGEWSYLAVIIDLYSRRIVGWELSQTRTTDLTVSALRKALRDRDVKPGIIFHSDRGAEYGAHYFQNELKRADIRPSMNRAGHMTDNAHVESFFRTMKTESFHGLSFSSVSELRMTLACYIDGYYNAERLHSSLGYSNPNDYERITV